MLTLVVACINFVTLSVGKSLNRAWEVGVRKTARAERKHLMTQSIGESISYQAIKTAWSQPARMLKYE